MNFAGELIFETFRARGGSLDLIGSKMERPSGGPRQDERREDAEIELEPMPVIAKFYGIVIRMLWIRSLGARIHAFYGDSELVVSLWPVRVVQGDAPQRVCDLVLEWAQQHQQELLAGWRRLQSGLPPVQVAPLQ